MIESAKSRIPTSLASSLEPVLINQTQNQLSDIHWFRTDWQRSGAATGFAKWNDTNGNTSEVVIKFPVIERELRWTRRMQGADAVAPTLFASGEQTQWLRPCLDDHRAFSSWSPWQALGRI